MAKTKKMIARLQRKKRIRARISGTTLRPRLTVSRSNMHISAQLIDDTGGKTLASADDRKEKKGTKMDRAKAVGKKLAELAQEKGLTTCVFDRSGHKYHGRVKVLAEAAREAHLIF